MLKSKKGHLASELLNYRVRDRHSKKIGKISDLLINSRSHKIDYIIVGRKKWQIPVSFINDDDSKKKEIMVSQTKDRIKKAFSLKPNVISKKCYYFSDVKKSIVYDITGSELGHIANIAYHPGLRVDFLVQKEVLKEESSKNEIRFPNYFVIPVGCICQFLERSAILGISQDELDLINFTGFHHLFLPYQVQDRKKRYVIVEAPATTVSYSLTQRVEALEKASESQSLFIEELDVSHNIKLRQFVKLFNLVLATSPDTYLPLSTEDAQKYFRYGTFIAVEHYRPIGYCTVTIEKQEGTNQKIGVLAGVGVHPSCRGRNIALALLNKSLRYMIDKNVDIIQADIYELNMPSLKLFSSLGFREIGETFLA
ncbi:MAG: GNAT family N-acetyltransferase [Candidatus Heimdallarchaeota archaeon]|nr:MAG: GNAT family N-acetyltransferase [Candidatus Heimdallarchaeota archaeon]